LATKLEREKYDHFVSRRRALRFLKVFRFSALRFREPHSKSVNLENYKKITKKACNRKRVFLYSFPCHEKYPRAEFASRTCRQERRNWALKNSVW
jgi:hypothetical protein